MSYVLDKVNSIVLALLKHMTVKTTQFLKNNQNKQNLGLYKLCTQKSHDYRLR